MSRKTLTLSQLIKDANRKIETERDSLIHIAKAGRYQGTVDEIMSFLDRNDPYFEDKNIEVVKAALESFLKQLSAPALKLTMASVKRELEKHIEMTEQEAQERSQILSQNDLDLLLAEATSSPTLDRNDFRESRIQRKDRLDQDPEPAHSQGVVSQEDIDRLLNRGLEAANAREEREYPDPEKAEPHMENGPSGVVDQSDIDALLREIQTGSSEPGNSGESELPDDNSASVQEPAEYSSEQDAVDDFLEQHLPEERERTHPEEPERPEPEFEDEVERPAAESAPEMEDLNEDPARKPEPDSELSASLTGNGGDPDTGLPLEPDLEAGDVPLDIDITYAAPEMSKQESVDAILEAVLNGEGGGRITEGPLSLPGPSSGRESMIPDYVVEERGDSKIIGVSYRVYLCRNGEYDVLSEVAHVEEAKDALLKAWMEHPAKEVVLRKVTRKEVLVIKDDLEEVPVRVDITVGQ